MNIPRCAGSLVGRRAELHAIGDALQTGARIVTLRGVGGVGKTRVAIAFAEECRRGERPAWICDAASAKSVADLCAAVARALDLRGGDAPRIERLASQIGVRLARAEGALVVIDNFEQLPDDAAHLVDAWAAAAPGVSFLVTSRRAVGARDERLIDVGPLDTANATELFVARAAARVHGPVDAERDAETVTAIVRRLEGLPLAIELAAARLDILPLLSIAERVSERFALLRDPLSSDERQGTLWRVIDWSWNLLAPWQKQALAQASVFEGAFDLEDAAAILDLPGGDDRPSALDAMHALVRQSLARVHAPSRPGAAPRFSLADSVREFAGAKLEGGAARAVHERHARRFVTRGRAAYERLEVSGDVEAIGRLEADRDDIMKVLRRALSARPATERSADEAVDAMLALVPVLTFRSALDELVALLDATLALVRALGRVDRRATEARLELARAPALRRLGQLEAALVTTERARHLARSARAPLVESMVLAEEAACRRARGEAEAARRAAESAAQLARELGASRQEGVAFAERGHALVDLAAFEDARADLGRAAELARMLGARADEAFALAGLAAAEFERGELAAAEAHFERIATLAEATGDRRQLAVARGYLGGIAHAREDLAAAREAYEWTRAAFAELPDPRLEAIYRGYVGIVEVQRGDLDAGAERITVARARLAEMGDRHYSCVMSAALTGVRVLRGDPGGAAVELVAIERALGSLANACAAQVADVYRGVIEAARGDVAAARRRAELLARVQSEDVRLALPLLRRLVRDAEARALAWSFDARGVAFRPPGGEWVTLGHRSPLARILAALARQHLEHRAEPLPKVPLVRAAWPDELELPPAVANNRLKVAMNTLRKMGLGQALLTRDGGYLFDPNMPIYIDTPSVS